MFGVCGATTSPTAFVVLLRRHGPRLHPRRRVPGNPLALLLANPKVSLVVDLREGEAAPPQPSALDQYWIWLSPGGFAANLA